MRLKAAVIVLLAVGTACEPAEQTPAADPDAPPTMGADTAGMQQGAQDPVTVNLIDAEGQAAGTATLTQQDGGVEIAVRVSGLEPGLHGFHVHENAACEPPSFQSAGGHFAPEGRQHGTENPQGAHAGDLPNIRAGDDGVADTTFVAQSITLDEGASNSVFANGGTALMVHEGEDDLRTDPSGDAGGRVACGVIERS